MIFVFRVDASVLIGAGHVMRCLTLADALRECGHSCHFICRSYPGNLISLILSKGYPVFSLDNASTAEHSDSDLIHGDWLGVSQQFDFEQCLLFIRELSPDWIIIDHYSLDCRWELHASQYSKRIMVIDDLADRKHVADILLDQNLGRLKTDYKDLVPSNCQLLVGTMYTLLRHEFQDVCRQSVLRRVSPSLNKLLISLGGVDKNNMTSSVLRTLRSSDLPLSCSITVVMGASSPSLEAVRHEASLMLHNTEVLVAIDNMAEVMASSDLAIGAAGSSAWERCCLGLPSIMLVLASNQNMVARALHAAGAAIHIDSLDDITKLDILKSDFFMGIAHEMSRKASGIVDGKGVNRVVEKLTA